MSKTIITLKSYFSKLMNQFKTIIQHVGNQLIIIFCYQDANVDVFAVWY